MIKTRKELKFTISADFVMNFGYSKYSLKHFFIDYLSYNLFPKFFLRLRKLEYHLNNNHKIRAQYQKYFYKRICVKLGFSISPNVFGYGLVIPHNGTIVVGKGNTIGNYCVLHTSTCVSKGNKHIGNNFYLSTGSKVLKDVSIGDSVTVGANSLVNSSFEKSNIFIAGNPCVEKKSMDPWYIRDGEKYSTRVNFIENELRNKYKI